MRRGGRAARDGGDRPTGAGQPAAGDRPDGDDRPAGAGQPAAGDRPDERLAVGLVRGLHGLRGAVRVEVLSDEAARFEPGSVLHLEGDDRPLTVAWVQRDGPGLLVRFVERSTRESVEELRGRYLEAVAGPPLPEGHYYWHELIGVPVATEGGEALGIVEDVFRAGGGEVLVVRGTGRGEVLVPAVGSVVVDFSPRGGRILVDAEALDLGGEPPAPRPRGRRTTRALRPPPPTGSPRGPGTGAGHPADPGPDAS